MEGEQLNGPRESPNQLKHMIEVQEFTVESCEASKYFLTLFEHFVLYAIGIFKWVAPIKTNLSHISGHICNVIVLLNRGRP